MEHEIGRGTIGDVLTSAQYQLTLDLRFIGGPSLARLAILPTTTTCSKVWGLRRMYSRKIR